MPTQIFVNLPVQDLARSIAYFKAVGFSINPQFTDDTAACVVISDTIYAMLLTPQKFTSFIRKEIADSTKTTEVIVALSAASREAVDEFARKAVAAGGSIHREPDDLGWMYTQSIEDPDGHLWEMFWMDERKILTGNTP